MARHVRELSRTMHRITRRAALVSLGALATHVVNADTAMEEAARKEGGLTWYMAQVEGPVAEAMARAFTARHPGVAVNVIRTTGQVAYGRVQQELKNNAVQCDVLSTSDISHMPALKARNALANYVPPNATYISPVILGLSDPGYYYPMTTTLTLMTCNTQKVAADARPRTWTDMLDPRWKGQIALAHPAFSGCMGVWCVALRKAYGWEFFDKLAKNNPRIGRSLNDTITMLNAGECSIGVSPSSTSFASAEKGNPIGLIYPADGVSPCIGPSAVLAAAPHPNAARLFMDWLLGDEFAQMFADAGGVPVHTGVPPKPGTRPLDQVNLLTLSVAEIGKGVPEVTEQWRETFGN